MYRYLLTLITLGLLGLGLAACAKEGNASSAIENYLKAKVASNSDQLVSLSCSAWEANARTEATSFESVKAELKDLSCSENGQDGDYTLVICTGQIVVAYDGETRALDVGDTTYLALQEDGEWKMCGIK